MPNIYPLNNKLNTDTGSLLNTERPMRYLAIRANASEHMGTGHVMRCLALAQAWQDRGGAVLFILVTSAIALVERLKNENMQVICLDVQTGGQDDADKTIELVHNYNASWLVIDGYDFDADYQALIKQQGIEILFIDDYGHASRYFADFVLNQNIYANESFYQMREASTKFLLGTRYALLRREFRCRVNSQRKFPQIADHILVTLGGSDPDNVTAKVINGLQQLILDNPILHPVIKIVIGAANTHQEEIQAAVQGVTNFEVLTAVTDMPTLMAWADVAISAAGSTCWELAFMGIPVMTITLAANQEMIARGLASAGVSLDMGWHHHLTADRLNKIVAHVIFDQESRRQMGEHGQLIVDGQGAERVTQKLHPLTSAL